MIFTWVKIISVPTRRLCFYYCSTPSPGYRLQGAIPRHPGWCQLYPREVVKIALEHNAAAVILVHNHPSGEPEPSHADRTLTSTLKNALNMVGTQILDHVVVGSEGCVSLAERGYL